MPRYDLDFTFRFEGVDADDRSAALELCDLAIGTVIVKHPTTEENVHAEVEITNA